MIDKIHLENRRYKSSILKFVHLKPLENRHEEKEKKDVKKIEN